MKTAPKPQGKYWNNDIQQHTPYKTDPITQRYSLPFPFPIGYSALFTSLQLCYMNVIVHVHVNCSLINLHWTLFLAFYIGEIKDGCKACMCISAFPHIGTNVTALNLHVTISLYNTHQVLQKEKKTTTNKLKLVYAVFVSYQIHSIPHSNLTSLRWDGLLPESFT